VAIKLTGGNEVVMKAGEHSCFVYENERDWLPGVVAFVRSGLDSGGRVVYVNEEHAEPKLINLLAYGGIDITPYRLNNSFLVINYREFYMPGGAFDIETTLSALENELERARQEGFPSLWITGEMGWVLNNEGDLKKLAAYESLVNSKFTGGFPAGAMCQYNLSRFDSHTMLGVLKTHPKIMWNNQCMPNCFYIPPIGIDDHDNGKGEVKLWLEHVAEQQIRQEKLEQNEARYRVMFEATGTPTCIIDGNATITLVNRYWEKAFGYSREEAENKLHYFNLIHDEEVERAGLYFKLRPLRQTGIPDEYEIRLLDKKGNPQYAIANVQMIPGSDSRIISTVDITRRKLVEEELKQSSIRYGTLFENAPVAINEEDNSGIKEVFDRLGNEGVTDFRDYFTKHPDVLYDCCKLGKIIGFNKALLDIWEADTNEDVIESMHASFENNTDSARSHGDTLIRLAEGQTRFSKEDKIVTAKGNIKTVKASVVVSPGCEKTLARVYICFFDITELKNKTSELERYQAHLEELVKERTGKLEAETEKSRRLAEEITQLLKKETQLCETLQHTVDERARFTRFLVHELKTPLTPLIGSADILLGRVKGSDLERLAANVQRGAYSLNNRVNDLLDLARGEMGLLHLCCRWVDICALVKDVVSYMSIEFERRSQLVCLDLAQNPPLLWVDGERLKQVLLNLLENASKFTPVNGRIFVQVRICLNNLLVSIQDTGHGIRKERQENIFDDYSHVPKPADPAADMGIGLPLCKLLVELHGGELWLESEEGKGSVFSFSLPLSRNN